MKLLHWIELFLVLIFIAVIIAICLNWKGNISDYFSKDMFRGMAENLAAQFQTELLPPSAESLSVGNGQRQLVKLDSKTVGSWSFNLEKVVWNGHSVYLFIAIKNTSDRCLNFAEEDDSWQWKPIMGNRLCVVDSNNQVITEADKRIYESGFYNRTFQPGDEFSGTIKFTVESASRNVYLYLYRGSIPVDQLFYLGVSK
jgi:hypothetical protein